MNQATLRLDTHFVVAPIDRRIFSGFLEHLGRAVYQGVYDPGNELSDKNGFRHDVIAALKPLFMPLVRYPGGNFVSDYDWTDGIGPKANRPKRLDYAWQSIESNQFGTDEFMQWCKLVDTKPMMAVNLGTAGARQAAALLEYCNLPVGTAWADKRAANGHKDPYGVKVWCLGNEMDGPWQAGHVPADEYARRAYQAGYLMKQMDPTIQLVACGSSGRGMGTYLEYDRTAVDYCWDQIDFVSAHRYSENHRNDSAWFLAEGTEIDRIIEDYDGLLTYVRGKRRSKKHMHLSFDEWNVWYKAMGDKHQRGNWKEAAPLLEEVYNLEDALVAAQYLMAFIRRADVVKMACLAQIVNVIAPILTNEKGVLIQSIYHPIAQIAKLAHGQSLMTLVDSTKYKAGDRGEVAALDAAASYDPANGNLAVFLVNRDPTKALTASVRLADVTVDGVSATCLTGKDVKAANTWEHPNAVAPKPIEVEQPEPGTLRVTIPGPGMVSLSVKTTRR